MKNWSWLAFVAGAVVVGGAVGIFFAVDEAAEANDADYQACLIAHGYAGGGQITDEMVDGIAEDCL